MVCILELSGNDTYQFSEEKKSESFFRRGEDLTSKIIEHQFLLLLRSGDFLNFLPLNSWFHIFPKNLPRLLLLNVTGCGKMVIILCFNSKSTKQIFLDSLQESWLTVPVLT